MKKAAEEDVGQINRILNHPDVRPWIYESEGEIDFTGLVGKFLVYLSEHGVAIGEAMGDGEYLGVIAMEPEGRGKETIKLWYDLMDGMFFGTDAVRIYGSINRGNEKSLGFFRKLGPFMRMLGDRHIFEWNYFDWAMQSAQAEKAGEEVTGILDMDPQTKKMFGAFLLTLRGGWGGKAYYLFNRYAYLASKPQIRVCSQDWDMFEWAGIKMQIGVDYIVEV